MKSFGLIALVTVGLTLGACSEKPHALTPDESGRAEQGALKWLQMSGGKYMGCSGQDSVPVDGYVTCNAQDKDGKPFALQCGYESVGCKLK